MRKLVLESAVLLVVVVAVAFGLDHLERWVTPSQGVRSALAMSSAAVAVAAGLAAEAVARLADRPALRRISAAMMVCGLIVVPATAAGTAGAPNTVDTIVVASVRHIATLAVVVLLLLAVATFDRPRPWPVRGLRAPSTGLRALLVTLGCAAAGGTAAGFFPETAYSVVSSPALVYSTSTLWLNVGVITLLSGLLRRRRLLVWMGVGETAIVLGHLSAFVVGDPLLSSPLLNPGMRLVGLGLIIVAVLRVAYRTYQRLEGDRERLAEAESEAVEARERMSVQAHELRNALAGVDGAVRLLTSDDPGDPADRAALRAALSAELDRMRSMLSSESARPRSEPVRIKPLLEHSVRIWTNNGVRIALSADGDLAAGVPPNVVAQVLSNVLANCERHAPGARVRVKAYRTGDTARIEVRDDGPGIPAGQEREMLRRGVKGAGSVGDGIGLHVCHDLVVEHGGRLRLESSGLDGPGCLVVIDLPARTRAGAATSTISTSTGSGDADT
ncbi:sensor histidine kinase [Actinorugispora endophytica]|uniref:histidine kinase n=1 Tax=Actinorugispora endophytica TaxID=1605990 RepID=A0A4R6V299_9ACTN|nr:HAMP domain-containing sensor histidine kinase [Actinorugispora endophytica]TDQ52204.1 two-component system OmpR family sensor kinase [Actinorugispora endophytica]